MKQHAHRPGARRPSLPLIVTLAVVALTILAAGIPDGGAAREPRSAISADSLHMTRLDPPRPSSPAAARDRDAAILDSGRASTGGSAGAVPSRPAVRVPDSPDVVVPRVAAGGTAVYLGDSYTSGWAGAGIGARSWPRLASAELGWRTVNLAVPGTGFLNPGWTGQPIGSRVSLAIAARPDVVVVAGGHNDSRWSAGATASAADRVLERLHAALPDALLVVVGPIWQDSSPPQRCRVLRDRLRTRAASLGAIFIDPLGGGWFAGSNGRFIGSDGIHPTNAGHRAMADRFLAGVLGAAG